jgi:hypothetical protein
MNGEKYGEVLKIIFLYNNTIMSHTESVPKYIKEQLQTRLKCSPKFVLQIDDSTHVVGLAQLLQFVRHCFEEYIQLDFIFCLLLSEGFTGSDLFKAMNDYFSEEIFLCHTSLTYEQMEQHF